MGNLGWSCFFLLWQLRFVLVWGFPLAVSKASPNCFWSSKLSSTRWESCVLPLLQFLYPESLSAPRNFVKHKFGLSSLFLLYIAFFQSVTLFFSFDFCLRLKPSNVKDKLKELRLDLALEELPTHYYESVCTFQSWVFFKIVSVFLWRWRNISFYLWDRDRSLFCDVEISSISKRRLGRKLKMYYPWSVLRKNVVILERDWFNDFQWHSGVRDCGSGLIVRIKELTAVFIFKFLK